jgi:hypothetical protein
VKNPHKIKEKDEPLPILYGHGITQTPLQLFDINNKAKSALVIF